MRNQRNALLKVSEYMGKISSRSERSCYQQRRLESLLSTTTSGRRPLLPQQTDHTVAIGNTA
ncbi:hypothetical protein DPMN_125102 [Dreissena polymorpha]|uniref:Uncharacterized protein n=1 Tax=Dreissena polymorpha TaxID=45954 RepID=A0A9D4GWW0_DREPO|nr:hypothetical protein DPMN_125102 [Dreissena polymorpha]